MTHALRFGHRAQVTAGIILVGLLGGASATAHAGPIVAELFISNSCSSCPPAYDALDRLTQQYADSNTPIIRLDEHVDYWNHLNWTDRYSKAQFSQRQRHYANDVLGDGRVYTPELVINGRTGMVGSNTAKIEQAIDRQANTTQALNIDASANAAQITVHVHLPASMTNRTLWIAVTQDQVVSHVGRGENAGRTLAEDGVVRHLESVSKSGEKIVTKSVSLPPNVKTSDLNVIAFVENASHEIVAAGKVAVSGR